MRVCRSIHVAARGSILFFSWPSGTPSRYVPHLYPFLCRWAFRLFCCLGCCEHRGAWCCSCLRHAPPWALQDHLFLIIWAAALVLLTCFPACSCPPSTPTLSGSLPWAPAGAPCFCSHPWLCAQPRWPLVTPQKVLPSVLLLQFSLEKSSPLVANAVRAQVSAW